MDRALNAVVEPLTTGIPLEGRATVDRGVFYARCPFETNLLPCRLETGRGKSRYIPFTDRFDNGRDTTKVAIHATSLSGR